ncbi:phosphoadenosine phosphosulfate reductase family protein [Dictyocaulus viviparus]|uniref:FAD synthase n=1 Tax=Dictyocaulus viviparus TaxID=29172 RepID=A0A0D8Y5Z7_DICVI|nr:phosphoadenosine phosphosulfate reductase family protein [Dictyocaulus viviparus]
MIPKSAELLWSSFGISGKQARFPIVRLHNVIVLPGVPSFCERAFEEIKVRLFLLRFEKPVFDKNIFQDQVFPPSLKPLFSKTIYTSESELKFADSLSEIASKYEGVADIGSYPVMNNSFFKTKLIVESESYESGHAAAADVIELLGDTIVHYDSEPWVDTSTKFYTFRERELIKNPEYVLRLDNALKVLREIVDRYPKFGPEVVIHGFHIMCEDQFPEATQFIIDAAKNYNIIVTEYPGPIKSGLELLKNEQKDVIAVLLGSRLGDPHGKNMKSEVQWTDENWPRFLRVCPILSWSYRDVWTFLRNLCVPYCPLYDMGYTSLGGRSTTVKNPLLKFIGKDGIEKYKPAYVLSDGDAERNGRSLSNNA